MTILINNKPYEVPKPAMTREEIKELAEYGHREPDPVARLQIQEYWVILLDGTEEGSLIDDHQLVDMQSGMQFRIINAATFGAKAA